MKEPAMRKKKRKCGIKKRAGKENRVDDDN